MTSWSTTRLLLVIMLTYVHATSKIFHSTNFPLDDYVTNKPILGLKKAKVLKNVPLEVNTTYYITGRVRLLDDPVDAPFAMVNTFYINKFKKGGKKRRNLGKQMMVNTATGWFEFGGDFTTLEDSAKVDILVSVYKQRLKFEVSPASLKLQKLTLSADWKDEANSRIEKIRKGNLNMQFKNNQSYDTNKLEFRLEQTKAAFPFGTAVKSDHLTSSQARDIKYREQLTKFFNWGTPANELKWLYMERTEGSPKFGPGDEAIEGLEKLNMKARGHCLAWSKDCKIPEWLVDKSAADIKRTVSRRWSYVAKRWGNRFAHWDVNNENLHEPWHSQKLNDSDFMSWMFKEFHKLVPNAQLFINDFDVFANGSHNLACKRQVDRLIKTGAPIGGIGVQSHFGKPSSIASYMKRLSVLGDTGIPVWMTEFDIRFGTEDEQVAFLDDILRLTYSLPFVQGIIFWGFWDGHVEPGVSAFMTGDNFELTKLGKTLEQLLLKEWRTHKTFGLPSSLSLTKRVFYGQYKLTATYKNSTLWTKNIQLQNDTNKVFNINI